MDELSITVEQTDSTRVVSINFTPLVEVDVDLDEDFDE